MEFFSHIWNILIYESTLDSYPKRRKPSTKSAWFLLFIALVVSSCSTSSDSKTAYQSEILKVRKSKNKLFASPNGSPLPSAEIKTFAGLDYFPIDSNYKVNAKLEHISPPQLYHMPNTGRSTETYFQSLKLKFNLNGNQHELMGFQSIEDPEVLFIPFKDASNGFETYGGGRYLELTYPAPDQTSMCIDFNLAFSPYCAYGGNYVCPIPPVTNTLATTVKAGEKKY